jgi:hypothetical protein
MIADSSDTFPTVQAVPVTFGGRDLRVNDIVHSASIQRAAYHGLQPTAAGGRMSRRG